MEYTSQLSTGFRRIWTHFTKHPEEDTQFVSCTSDFPGRHRNNRWSLQWSIDRNKQEKRREELSFWKVWVILKCLNCKNSNNHITPYFVGCLLFTFVSEIVRWNGGGLDCDFWNIMSASTGRQCGRIPPEYDERQGYGYPHEELTKWLRFEEKSRFSCKIYVYLWSLLSTSIF